MGSNDLWSTTSALKDSMISKIKSLYPNAKYYILNGNYGWGGLSVTTANTPIFWKNRIDTYIQYYSARGFEIIGTVTQVSTHPATGDALFNSFATSLKAKGII
jgi:hypothetical protein